MPTVVTWNVAGRVRGVPEQAAALADQPADVIALQEVRLSSLGPWREALAALGFGHVVTSLDAHDPAVRLPPDRRLGVLVAGRAPVEPLGLPPGVPWPERVLCASTALGELVNVHAPLSNKAGAVKVRTLEAVFAHLAAPSPHARIVVGDFNTPAYESREGEVRTFARTRTASATTAPSSPSSRGCSSTATRTRSGRCTATNGATAAGSTRTGRWGTGSTTSSCAGSRCARASTATTGARRG
jgi:endonuclease/exonuclease/phosphatase family metal-dependent hydrolase